MRARRLLRKIQGHGGAVDFDAWDLPIRKPTPKGRCRVTDRTKFESASRMTQKHVDGQITRLRKAGLIRVYRGNNRAVMVAAVRRALA